MRRLSCALALSALLAGAAGAHDGTAHGGAAEALGPAAAPAPAPAVTPAAERLPFDLGGPFALVDDHGRPRTEVSPEGHLQLLFFGYANCRSICSVALPLMGEVSARLRAEGLAVTPLMITVDPARDTVGSMTAPLSAHDPDFVGLTGTADALQAAYDAFAVEHSLVFEDPDHGPVYAHGSHIYLLDATGAFLTLIPPILSADRAAQIVHSYAGM